MYKKCIHIVLLKTFYITLRFPHLAVAATAAPKVSSVQHKLLNSVNYTPYCMKCKNKIPLAARYHTTVEFLNLIALLHLF